ncbi:MAG: isoaspartyl peptidase/L-asparaginase family protein [Longimicrobiales bacterium]
MHQVRTGWTAALVAAAVVSGGCQAGESGQAEGDAGATMQEGPRIEYGMVIHGGAGTITPESMTPELERQYRDKMTEALQAGYDVLQGGGSSLDAVVAAITTMEDSPLFNAGKGAVFTADGTNSLDSSIMDGATLTAGAVAGVTHVKNPILLARLVMEESPHVMLAGEGAEEFARLHDVELVDPSYFRTERRWRALQEAKAAEAAEAEAAGDTAAADTTITALSRASKFGTVGAVALDREGNIAAGTSTGGMTNKKWGRIGDSPIIGAGTYANESCGISATGWGEFFIRNVVAYDICARAKYNDIPLRQAAHEMIMEQLEAQEPETGGIIALSGAGDVVMTFNTTGMYRGWIDQDGRVTTEIYGN